jgi:threonine synthase
MFSYLNLASSQKIAIGDPIDICVPTGNFGNILAALLAKECGIFVRKFVCASNDNNVLSDFLRTGVYDIKERSLVKTDSPSIDILKSSNLERLLYVLDRSSDIATYFKDLDSKKEFKVEENVFFKLKVKIIKNTFFDCFKGKFLWLLV